MAERTPEGPAPLPPGLRADWPAPWQPLEGSDDSWPRHVEHALLRWLLALAARLPERPLGWLLGALARVAKPVDRRHAAAARRFLRQALGELPPAELERRVVQAYRHLLRVAVDVERLRLRVPFERMREHFDVRWRPEVEAARDAGQGCVIVTGHVGSWEAAAAIVPWVGFDPVYVVAKPPRSRPLSRALQAARERIGVRVLPRRGAMQAAPAVVRAGGTICMLLDQRARKRPVLAPFFGRPARCDRSAGVLMRRLGVPVVIAACFLTEEPLHYEVEFPDVILPEEVAELSPEAIAARINRALEAAIRSHPEQYFWLHDRYRDTPEGPGEGDGAPGPAGEGLPGAGEPRGALPGATLRTGRGVSSNAADAPGEPGAGA